jgi:hypothetical protein
MELKILKEDKEEIEVEIDNVTLAEVLRVSKGISLLIKERLF